MPLTIERLNLRGEGVAGDITAPRTLPGEVIEGEVLENRIAEPRILTPSPDRVAAPCPHFRACGGCALMHAADPFVAEWKQGLVVQALAAQGLSAPFLPMLTSPPQSRRRATLAGRRLKSGVLVGFHGRKSAALTAVPDCRLLDPALLATIPALEALTTQGASRKGEVAFALTRLGTGTEVAATGGKPLDRALRASLAMVAGAHDLARLVWEGEVLFQPAPPEITLGRACLQPPPAPFLQATPQGEAALLAAARRATQGAARIADLFAGCGTFALPLAETAEIHAVEGNKAALAALHAAANRTPGLKPVTTEARDLFRRPLLSDELARFDAVVIDPPRAGSEAQTKAIATAQVAVVCAISCNPVTFARDARLLAQAGYRLDWVQVVDQFRWSAHVELAARFHLPHMARSQTPGSP